MDGQTEHNLDSYDLRSQILTFVVKICTLGLEMHTVAKSRS